MNNRDIRAICLQRYPEYFEQTITLLNNQWPRSVTARLRSLEQGSADSLPSSLVMLQKDETGKEIVIAHSKISPVPYQPHLCFVESVVVSPELRGKGLGRRIMEITESYVKSLGIHTVYLTTIDQQGFYGKLGYELCDPIVVFGGSIQIAEKAKNLNVFQPTAPVISNSGKRGQVELERKPVVNQSLLPPPPPPPPPPQLSSNNNIPVSIEKVTMRKVLSN